MSRARDRFLDPAKSLLIFMKPPDKVEEEDKKEDKARPLPLLIGIVEGELSLKIY